MDRIFGRVSVLVLFVLFARPVLCEENNAVLPMPVVPLVRLADHTEFHRLYANTPDEAPPSSLGKAYTATVAGVPLRFLDSDENGKIDGWMVVDKLYHHWLPIREKNVISQKVGKTVYPVEIVFNFDEELKTVSWELSGVPTFLDRWPADWGKPSASDKATFSDAAKRSFGEAIPRLLRLNDLRMRQGLPPVSYDPELSLACLQHGWYMEKTGDYEHEEKPGPWYSKAGDNAGRASNLIKVGDDPIGYDFQTFFHRGSTFDPTTHHAGIAVVGPYTVLDCTSSKVFSPDMGRPRLSPANFSTGIPLAGMGESESPHPDLAKKGEGGAISGFGIWARIGFSPAKGVRLGLWKVNSVPDRNAVRSFEVRLLQLLSSLDENSSDRTTPMAPSSTANYMIGRPDFTTFIDMLKEHRPEPVAFLAAWPGNPLGVDPHTITDYIGIIPKDFLKPKASYLWAVSYLAPIGADGKWVRQAQVGVFETGESIRLR